jgi:hypothetical protein
MAKGTLPRGAVRLISQAVDKVFDRVLQRFLEHPQGDKRIYVGAKPRVTLPSLFRAASASEHVKADEAVLSNLMELAKGFLDAQRAATKARTIKAVQSWLSEAHASGVKTDLETVLGGELASVFGKAHHSVKKILDTEATTARNTGTLDGIIKVNQHRGIEDPVVFFIVVRDNTLCDECKRLHLLPDGKTPRVYHLSDLGHGYHVKGDDKPKVNGLHPHCRCSLNTLMPGYGFDAAGFVDWIGFDHDEVAKQRGVAKREYDWAEGLFKSYADIAPGQPTTEPHEFDYNHVLTPEHRAAGFNLRVTHNNGNIGARVSQNGNDLGGVWSGVEGDTLTGPVAGLHSDKHKGMGLGRAMYEALFTHAFHNGIRRVQGGGHSAAASQVHQRLAQKHGLDYVPTDGSKQYWNGRKGPYEYMLKNEDD